MLATLVIATCGCCLVLTLAITSRRSESRAADPSLAASFDVFKGLGAAHGQDGVRLPGVSVVGLVTPRFGLIRSRARQVSAPGQPLMWAVPGQRGGCLVFSAHQLQGSDNYGAMCGRTRALDQNGIGGFYFDKQGAEVLSGLMPNPVHAVAVTVAGGQSYGIRVKDNFFIFRTPIRADSLRLYSASGRLSFWRL